MGAAVSAAEPRARAVFERAAAVLDWDLADVCFAGPPELLARTRRAQPAIFTVSIACLAALTARGIRPSAVAGHSLGEWGALVAAGVLGFDDGLRAVQRRAELMEAVGSERVGVMTAVIGVPDDLVRGVCGSLRGDGVLDVVIRNAPDQVVISGSRAEVESAERELDARGATCIRIPTPNAFHTSLVAPVAAGLDVLLRKVEFRRPRVPFCSNWTGDFLWEPEEIRRSLVAQVTGPIDWVAVAVRLLATGHRVFVEVGPRNVLAGLLRRIEPHATCFGTGTAPQLEKTFARFASPPATESRPCGTSW